MQKKFIYTAVATIALLSMGISKAGYSDCGVISLTGKATPWVTTDVLRSVSGIVKSILELTGDGEVKAKIIAIQEETNSDAAGSPSAGSETIDTSSVVALAKEEEGKAGANQYKGSAYSYVKTNLLDKGLNVIGYQPLKSALASNSSSVRDAVISTLYAQNIAGQDEQTKTEYQERILRQRKEYAREASERHITLAYRVLWENTSQAGGIAADLKAISTAPLTGSGELGAIAVDGYTLDQAIKMELVDLAIQIELMEADAIQFMLHQPVEIMSAQKPSQNG